MYLGQVHLPSTFVFCLDMTGEAFPRNQHHVESEGRQILGRRTLQGGDTIHEGTAGIHALTLLGRKVRDGKAGALFDAMLQAVDEAEASSYFVVS